MESRDLGGEFGFRESLDLSGEIYLSINVKSLFIAIILNKIMTSLNVKSL